MITSIKNKFAWLFSGHYKMERFGVMFVSLVICMALVVSSITIRKAELDRAALGNQAVYTTTYSMSLTGLAGTVVNVYGNTNRTKAFLLLKWTQPNQIVSDAGKYKIYLTGSDLDGDKVELQSSPSASIYMFGASGYMGIYLVDSDGFPPQILNLTLRCETMVAPLMPEIPTYQDASFSKYDQCEIMFNPGGTSGTIAEFLDDDRMSIYDICEGTMVAGQEELLRTKLDTDLTNMEAALRRIDEFAYRVEKEGLVAPDAPIQIRGDEILTDEAGVKTFASKYDISGGYDFDWRSGSILTGYLDSVIPQGYSPAAHLTMSANLANRDKFVVADIAWMNADGTQFNSDNPQRLPQITRANEAITQLTQAWTEYYTLKKAYQTVDLPEMLKLELSLRDMMDNYTVRTENVITLW